MKKCSYCGKSYSDELTHCPIDAEPLEGPEGSGRVGPDTPPGTDGTGSRWVTLLLVVVIIGILAAGVLQFWVVVWTLLSAMWAFMFWMDSGLWRQQKMPLETPEPEEVENIPPKGEEQIPFRALLVRAQKTVEGLIARLPVDLRAEAEKVPCFIEDWPRRVLKGMPLGVYHGFEPGRVSQHKGPIIIYVGLCGSIAKRTMKSLRSRWRIPICMS